MLQIARIAAATTALMLMPWTASAQRFNPVDPFASSWNAARMYSTSPQHSPMMRDRHVRLNTDQSGLPPVSVVGPDNYKYARQACCF